MGFLSSLLPYFLQNMLASFYGGNMMDKMIEHQVPGQKEGTLTVRDDRTGQTYRIPIIHNSIPALGFRQIVKDRKGKTPRQQYEEGMRVIDPGYRNTAVKMSDITYINGEKGVILYRGHPLPSLVGKSYEEISHLITFGSLPTEKQQADWQQRIHQYLVVPDIVKQAVGAYPQDTAPIVLMSAALTAFLSTQPELIPSFVGKNLYCMKGDIVDEQIARALAVSAMAVIVPYCHKNNREIRAAKPEFNFIQNVLHMGGFVDHNPNVTHEKASNILTRLWTLYADHEMTCSTSAFLHIASALTDPVSCLAGSIHAGYGLLHGGAIDAAYKNMQDIGGPENVPALIERVIKKEARLSGYGHRIYKTEDPRASFIKEMLKELTTDVDIKQMDPILQTAMEIDRIASSHEYFTSRNLQANADLYGSFVYTALGIPSEFVVGLAMMSRVPGTMAHWKEAMCRPPELWRPLQVYTGPTQPTEVV